MEAGSSEIAASPFICLHHALQWLPRLSGVFSVFLDTTSRISNLAPPVGLDPSEHVVGGGRKLYQPLYLLACVDVDIQEISNHTLDEVFVPAVLFRYGRPLWSSLIGRETHEGIRRLAASKLVGGGECYLKL